MKYARLIASLILASMLVAAPAVAGEAQDALKPELDKMISILSDPQYKDGAHFEEQKQRIKDVIRHMVDFQLFTALAVGKRHWMQFTPDQRTRLVDAFTLLMENKYLDRIREYTNEQVRYVSEETAPNGRKARVVTEIVSNKVGQVPVTYSLYKDGKTGEWKVYDLKVEGVSMLSNWRTQFGEALQKMTPDELIVKMEEQAVSQKVESLAPAKDGSGGATKEGK